MRRYFVPAVDVGGHVTGRHVERVAGFEDLDAVAVRDRSCGL